MSGDTDMFLGATDDQLMTNLEDVRYKIGVCLHASARAGYDKIVHLRLQSLRVSERQLSSILKTRLAS